MSDESSLPPNLADQLAGLRQSYGKRLRSKVKELADALDAAKSAPSDSREIASVRRMAHKLHGTAGTYGYAAVSQAAGRIEDRLERVSSDENCDWDENRDWDEIAAALDQMKKEVP